MTIPIIRTFIMYIFVIVAVRLMGKRQVGDLSPGELVITILISETASIPIGDTSTPLINGIFPVIVLVCLELITAHFMLKSNKLRSLLTGKPIIIIKDGKIIEKEMAKVRFSLEDLMTELHQNGIFYIENVSYAIVETNGKISILPKPEQLPVVVNDIGKTQPNGGLPVIAVSDGDICEDSISLCGLNKDWVLKTLKNDKTKLSEVFLMTVDKSKSYYIVKKTQRDAAPDSR